MSASRKKSKTDSVRTPQYIIDIVKKEFGEILFDPAPYNPQFNPLKDVDGLKREWGPVSFVNCPYSRVKPWFKKSREEWLKGKTIILFIKLQCLGTQYCRQYSPGAEVRVLTRKVTFEGYDGTALFNNIFVIWRAGKTSNVLSFM